MNSKRTNFYTELLFGKLFPLLLLAVMACTYAIQLPQLGFYLDDWVSIAAYDQGGEEGLLSFGINDSRPFAAWITAKFFAILGTGILPWQLTTLFWRYAAAFTTFGLISSVWPRRKVTASLIALLFGIFPYFRHQAICIAYFMIFMQYFVIILSFLLTVKALQAKSRNIKVLLFFFSYLTSIFHLACLEYYLSLEAVRLILIYIVLRKRDNTSIGKTAKKAILTYIPYALILVFILVYRFVYIPTLSADVREVNIFEKYSGLNFVWHILGSFLQYLTESTFGVWYRSINPSQLDLTMRSTQLALAAGLLTGVIIFFVLQKSRSELHAEQDDSELLIFGAVAMLLGFLPGMAIDISPASESIYHDRYLIPSLWGIAILVITLITLAFKNKIICRLVLAVLFTIPPFFQIQNAYYYRYAWKYQQQFQWQLKWRVPDIAENTAVIGDGVIAPFMGGWADGSMLIEMYGKRKGIDPAPYWYFNIGEDNYLSAVGTENPIYIQSKMYEFSTPSNNTIIVTKPEYGRCLWLVDEADIDNPLLEPGILPYIPYQNKSRIIYDSDHILPPAVFGTDYVHDWCYYFEKADLACDMQNYEEALRLFDEAAAKNIRVGNGIELRPFIKSAAFTGEWDKALDWTNAGYSVAPEATSDYFENLWEIIDRDVPPSPEKSEAVIKAKEIISSGK